VNNFAVNRLTWDKFELCIKFFTDQNIEIVGNFVIFAGAC